MPGPPELWPRSCPPAPARFLRPGRAARDPLSLRPQGPASGLGPGGPSPWGHGARPGPAAGRPARAVTKRGRRVAGAGQRPPPLQTHPAPSADGLPAPAVRRGGAASFLLRRKTAWKAAVPARDRVDGQTRPRGRGSAQRAVPVDWLLRSADARRNRVRAARVRYRAGRTARSRLSARVRGARASVERSSQSTRTARGEPVPDYLF